MNKQSPFYTILFIIAVGVVFGFGISFVNYATLPLLKKNETMHKNKVMSNAFMLKINDNATAESYERAISDIIEPYPLEYESRKIEAYRNRENGDIGFIFSGYGFWDRITGIIVLSPGLDKIRNIRFFEQKETPGLGARIEEIWFTDQFKELPLNWDYPSDRRIIISQSLNAEARKVDAVTGATQTSIALMNVLNTELDIFKKSYEKRKVR